MLDPTSLPNGGEQYETFTPAARKAGKRVQYDYRDIDGELFSCVKRTLEECRTARDSWCGAKNDKRLTHVIAYMVATETPLEKLISELEATHPSLMEIIN